MPHADNPPPWPPRRLPPTPEQWQAHRERCYQEAMAAIRKRYGVDRAVDTGPATAQDIEAAREALGNPANHEGWQAVVTVRRRERTRSEQFTTALNAALDRLASLRIPADAFRTAGQVADLELDLAAAALDRDNPAALTRALQALERWEATWREVAGVRASRIDRKEARA
ncbi:hypothetical protein ACFL51_02185 [Myxococcota bacterium]